MKTKEFNLSENEMSGDRDFKYYSQKDVKEFIKRLKEEYINWNNQATIKNWNDIPKEMIKWRYFIKIIDKLAGDKLR